jgi:alanine-synthesizing transaminase
MFSRRTNWRLLPNRLTELLEERRGLSTVDLTESNPTRCGFVYDWKRILSALDNPQSLAYQPDPRGPRAAREAVAAYYGERGVTVDLDQIFITASTSEAYSYVFRLLVDAGDSILVPQPSYPLVDFLAQLDDVVIDAYPLAYGDGWQIDRVALQQQIRPESRAVLLVNPNNPTGSYVSAEDRRFVAKLCGQQELAIVADEVFLDYSLAAPNGNRAKTLAGETMALTFTLSGLSKISALPQMKLAWIVVTGPAKLRDEAIARLEVVADTYLSVSVPLGLALPELLDTRVAMQSQIQRRIQTNLMRLDALLSAGPPVSRLKAEGGWTAVLRVPAVRIDEEWAVTLLKRDGVLVHPGHFYDFSAEGYLVVSLLAKPQNFEEGIRRLLARIQHEA